MRVGEANNLRERDLIKFTDDLGRENYRFIVNGKTGEHLNCVEVAQTVQAVGFAIHAVRHVLSLKNLLKLIEAQLTTGLLCLHLRLAS